MESGQSSGTKQEDDVLWAKLVPSDSRYSEVEIRSGDSVVSSQIEDSSLEKREWCEIVRNRGRDSATIRNLSSNAIIINDILIGEEIVEIKSGSEIVSGPQRKGYISYNFEITTQELDHKNIKISMDVEHAKCSICLNIWHDVVTVAPCFHNFCNGCFSEWSRRSSTQFRDKHESVACPQCRANVNSVGRNHFLRNIEEAILQAFSSLKRSDEEIALLDTHASVKPNLVLGIQGKNSKKRSLPFPNDGSDDMELLCPQCGNDFAGFRCTGTTLHLQCQQCRGPMPNRSNIGVPQQCLGCDRTFCGAYWLAQGVNSDELGVMCSPETFRPISERTVSHIPASVHENNLYELDITAKCIQQSGKTLQAVISDSITKFNNRQIDRSRLNINHAETITGQTHLCNDCFTKFVDFLLYWFRITLPTSLLPPEAVGRENCWYGYLCRTQHHNTDHAQKRNHVCRPTRGPTHPL